MTLGERLLNLRKEAHLSQEEVAEKLDVTRQTVSKWETDQSTPDFDKIVPLCKLYNISSDELLTGNKKNRQEITSETKRIKKTRYILISVLLFFLSITWIMISIPVLKLNPLVASAIFLLIIAGGVCFIIYSSMIYKEEKKKEKNKLLKQIDEVLSLVVLIVYLGVSFLTRAWHITWIIWIVYALIIEIIKLVFVIRGDKVEE